MPKKQQIPDISTIDKIQSNYNNSAKIGDTGPTGEKGPVGDPSSGSSSGSAEDISVIKNGDQSVPGTATATDITSWTIGTGGHYISGSFDLSTGKFTAGISGKFHIKAIMSLYRSPLLSPPAIVGSAYFYAQIVKNPDTDNLIISSVLSEGKNGYSKLHLQSNIILVAGDVIVLRLQTNWGPVTVSSGAYNSLLISRFIGADLG
jgi:hypothetical protein